MQDFCEFCGRDGLVLTHAPMQAHRGLSVPSAHATARTHLHVDHTLPTRSRSLSTEVVVFADLLDRARPKRAA
jgi:hypothetical protein